MSYYDDDDDDTMFVIDVASDGTVTFPMLTGLPFETIHQTWAKGGRIYLDEQS